MLLIRITMLQKKVNTLSFAPGGQYFIIAFHINHSILTVTNNADLSGRGNPKPLRTPKPRLLRRLRLLAMTGRDGGCEACSEAKARNLAPHNDKGGRPIINWVTTFLNSGAG